MVAEVTLEIAVEATRQDKSAGCWLPSLVVVNRCVCTSFHSFGILRAICIGLILLLLCVRHIFPHLCTETHFPFSLFHFAIVCSPLLGFPTQTHSWRITKLELTKHNYLWAYIHPNKLPATLSHSRHTPVYSSRNLSVALRLSFLIYIYFFFIYSLVEFWIFHLFVFELENFMMPVVRASFSIMNYVMNWI